MSPPPSAPSDEHDPHPSPRVHSTRAWIRAAARRAGWIQLDLRRGGRLLFHSVLVGIMAGGVAIAFTYALDWTQWLLLEGLAHLTLPQPGAEARLTPAVERGLPRWWLVALLPALGGLLCGLLTTFVAPEAAGPGGDAYIEAFHHRGGLTRKRVPFIKALASLLTIGTGGSAGREGPTAQVSAGLGSLLSRWLHLGERERRLLFVAGAAAGTGAMFRAPLGGAFFAIEVLYREDFETDAIIPSITGSVIAYWVLTAVLGPGHLFDVAAQYDVKPSALPLYLAMAVGLSLTGLLYIKLRRSIEHDLFRSMRAPAWIKPAVGGLALGLLALAVPQSLGAGYGWIQDVIDGADWIPTDASAYLVLLGVALAKVVAMGLTIGSGGSGGEMGPSMVVGGLVGGAFGMLFHGVAPDLVPQPDAFVLVGMGAFFGGVGKVPIASLIMVCELAGSYDLLVPLMLCEGVTFVMLRKISVYGSQVDNRHASPAHRDELRLNILGSWKVGDVFDGGTRMGRVSVHTPLTGVTRVMRESALPAVLVEDMKGEVAGMVGLDTLQCAVGNDLAPDVAVAADLMVAVPTLRRSDDLRTALQAFLGSNATVLPVFAEGPGPPEPIGVLTHAQVDRAYEDGTRRWPPSLSSPPPGPPNPAIGYGPRGS